MEDATFGGRDQVITVLPKTLSGSFKHNENERSCPKMRSVFLGGFLLNQNEQSHTVFKLLMPIRESMMHPVVRLVE